MNDIKSALSALCKEIKCTCDIDLKTEHLRLAKFNEIGEDNVETLWQVLYALCIHLCEIRCETENNILYVKRCFASLMYERIGFYKLSESKETGSRELLIALAWLIAKKNAFNRLINYKIREFEEHIIGYFAKSQSDILKHKMSTEHMNLVENLNYISFLCGKIKNNMKDIYGYNEEKIKLAHKVHDETQGISGLPHLSVAEATLFLQNELDVNTQKLFTQMQAMLSAHRKWKNKSYVFWRWMDTVLEKEAEMDEVISHDKRRDYETLVEFIQIIRADMNSRVHNSSISENRNSFTRFIMESRSNENKTSESKIYQDMISEQLEVIKESLKDKEMELYVKLKNIAEKHFENVVFVIPQMYCK